MLFDDELLPENILTLFPECYQRTQVLAQGGMGWVYSAIYQGKKVCLKIPSLSSKNKMAEFMMRFQVERDTVFNLSHPRIVRGISRGELEYDKDMTIPYYSMEYCEGGTLRDKLNKDFRIGKHEALNIIVEIASALDYFHKTNCVYRDLKPENIFFDGHNKPKLGDFGTIKDPEIFLTQKGDVVGSFYYCAPEQLLNQKLDKRVDIFALGLILFEMITGRKIGDQITDFWKKQNALSALQYDPFLWELCSSMLAEKEHRLPSMSQVVDKIYSSRGGAKKKFSALKYYAKDWWYGKHFQRHSLHRSEIIGALQKITDLIEQYSIEDIAVEIVRKLKPFPIHLIANEIPGFLTALPLPSNEKLAKALCCTRNKKWLSYLINHLVVHSAHDDTAVLLTYMLLLNPEERGLRKKIAKALEQIWCEEQIVALLDLFDGDYKHLDSFYGEEYYAAFPIVINVLRTCNDVALEKRCLSVLASVSRALESTASIFVEFFDCNDSDVREMCAFALGKMLPYSNEVLPYLLSGLVDSAYKVRYACAFALGTKNRGSTEISALITGLYDVHPLVRKTCAKSLGKIGQPIPQVLDNLVERLIDRDSSVRKSCADSLFSLKWSPKNKEQALWWEAAKENWSYLSENYQEARDIVEYLLLDNNNRIRIACIKIVEKDREYFDVYLPLLILGLKNMRSKKYRRICAKALKNLEWQANTRENYAWFLVENKEWDLLPLLGVNCIPAIYQNLKDGDSETRVQILRALTKINVIDSKTIGLISNGYKEKYRDVRIEYANCLALMKIFTIKDALEFMKTIENFDENTQQFWSIVLESKKKNRKSLAQVRDTSISMRITYISSITPEQLDNKHVEFLLKQLQSRYVYYQLLCLKVLAQVPKTNRKSIKKIIAHLLLLLKSNNPELQVASVQIISTFCYADKHIIRTLTLTLADNNDIVSSAVELALTRLKDIAIPFLFSEIENCTNKDVLKKVLLVIKKTHSSSLLCAGLKHSHPRVRMICGKRLREVVYSKKEALFIIPCLMECANSLDLPFVDVCVDGLQHISCRVEDDIDIFIESLAHPNRKVRKVCKAIVTRKGKKATNKLIHYFVNGPSSISYRCAEILEQLGSKAIYNLMHSVAKDFNVREINKKITSSYLSMPQNKKLQLKKEDSDKYFALSKKTTSSFKLTKRIDTKEISDLSLPENKSIRKIAPQYALGFETESCSGLRLTSRDVSLGEAVDDMTFSQEKVIEKKLPVQEKKSSQVRSED
ncbi:HEAT repeat domain-containing protein [Candidatus Uabimicrobium sp. HlEnr_7]|uniref:protein kinase domain-containing protein n=1 Tax=Candidatus Uabimicrobium helgolandensis TaxID=3095367 RepID=UPI00355695FF